MNSFIVGVLFFSGCKNKESVNRFSFHGFGTVLSVIYTGKRNVQIERELKKDVVKVENELSYYKTDSYVSRINSKGFEKEIKVPKHVCEVIKKSINFGKDTGGAFDITYKSQAILWKDNAEKIPTNNQLAKKKILVGVDLIKADCVKGTVKTSLKGVLLDLGGIAKGYAVDRAGDILKKKGIRNFIVNYGGDMFVCGSKGKKKWVVGIKNPLRNQEVLKRLKLENTNCHGIATSGDYERFIKINGKKYTHIFDPGTGRPVKGVKSVTVVAGDALTADVLATAVSVKYNDREFIKKIMEKFHINIYTLVEKDPMLKEWE